MADYLEASTEGVELLHALTPFPDMGGTRAQWFTFTVDETASYHISAKGHCNEKGECLFVYMQLFEADGKTLKEEVDSSTVGTEQPVASISDKELGAGTYSLLLYSPTGSSEATLQIRRVDDSDISGMATQLISDGDAVTINTNCDTKNCKHSVTPGQWEKYPILLFAGKAGRTYNFTTASILGSDEHAVGVRLAAHIMPFNARGGHQVWDSDENRIESIMGAWRDKGMRGLNIPSETDSFKMYFNQYEDITKHFSWVVGRA
jgi:hypothetical protein